MIIIFLIGYVFSQLSQNYNIPTYYGSRELDFLLRGSVYTGNLSSFYWHPGIYRSADDLYYYSDSKNHVIWLIDQKQKKKSIVAGILGQKGYRDGDLINTLFNQPSGIFYFNQSLLAQAQERSKKTIVLKNNSTECQNVDAQNYTICEDIKEPSLSDPNYEIFDYINPYLIKDVYMLTNSEINELKGLYQNPFIYVADQGNNCIRKLDLITQICTTMAGICGQSGFKDGERGINMFSSPEHFGIDNLGNIFVYDLGNSYIRMITPQGNVTTLLGGACRQDVRYSSLFYQTLEVRRVICYKNWIKTSGQPSAHLLTPADDMSICVDHYTDCPYYKT